MPPRKSNASATAADGDKDPGFGVEELNLPRTMVQRLAKGVLPANTQIQKDALLAISKSATVFVNYLASSANENAQRLNKKTIQPKDVLDALADLEFAAFVPRCEGELQKYNTVQCDKRNTYRRRVKEEAKTKDGEDGQPGSEPGSAGAQDPTLASEESGANRNNAPGEASSWSEPASAGAARSPLGASASPGEPSSKRARGPTGVATSAAEEDDIDEDADMDETLEDMDDEDEDEESDHDDNDDGEDDQADGQQEPEGDTIDDMDMDNNDAAVMDESDDSVDSDDPAGTNPEEDEDD